MTDQDNTKSALTDDDRPHGSGLISKRRYKELLEIQDSTCAICGCRPGVERLYVDHDHENNKIRGLLCRSCNLLLGWAKDSPRILAAAIVYLEDNGNCFYTRSREED